MYHLINLIREIFINEKDLVTASLRLSLVRAKTKKLHRFLWLYEAGDIMAGCNQTKISRDILAGDGLILILISHTAFKYDQSRDFFIPRLIHAMTKPISRTSMEQLCLPNLWLLVC